MLYTDVLLFTLMVISPELRFQQERNVSDLLSRGDEMGEYYPFMRGFAFDDPLGIVVKHSNFYDQDIQQDLANYKIFPNLDVRSLKVEPIKNGFWENISLVSTLMESTAPEIRASMTKYFTSKLISLRTIMTASTIHEDNREMVAFTPKSLRFSPGDPMGRFTEQGTLDLRAVAFPLGYSTLRSFDGIVTNVLTQREVAYIDKGLNEGPRSIIEMFDQIPPMKDRLGFVRNIISFTIQNIMELNGGDGYPEIKKGVWEIVKNGEVITPHSVKNSTSTNSIDEIVGNRSDFERILPPLTFSF